MRDDEIADRLLKALADQARQDLHHEASVVQAEQAAGLTNARPPRRRRIVELLADRGVLVVIEWYADNDAVVRLTARGFAAARL